jgi:hypothetical protein
MSAEHRLANPSQPVDLQVLHRCRKSPKTRFFNVNVIGLKDDIGWSLMSDLAQFNPDAILSIAPSDHVVPDIDAFHTAVAEGSAPLTPVTLRNLESPRHTQKRLTEISSSTANRTKAQPNYLDSSKSQTLKKRR